MKAINRKSILTVIAIALVLSLTIGMTFAYFSDYSTAQGGGTLALGSQTDIEETVTDDSKTIKIVNTGETDVVVRVGIYGPDTMTVGDISGTDWVYDGGFWYYTKVLAAGASSSEITAAVKAPSGDAANFDVVVVHESAQVTYDEDGNINVPSGWVNKIAG